MNADYRRRIDTTSESLIGVINSVARIVSAALRISGVALGQRPALG
jgi:hypothetical protein